MKKRLLYLFVLATMTFAGCNKDFLTRYPLDAFTDDTYWTNENNIRTFAYGFYPTYFIGYGSGWTWGIYFSAPGGKLDDDWAPTTPPQFVDIVPPSGGGWGFTNVRKANIFIDRVAASPLADEAKNHWLGVARFFRGMAYFDLVKRFGDVPWFETVPAEIDNDELYKPRESRVSEMSKVLEDFQFAAANVRASDGPAKQSVNKWVVLSFMAKVFLFEGTWEKYHATPGGKATEFLQAAKTAAAEVINNGGFNLTNNYRSNFNSLDLASNSEMIMYRHYAEGIQTHALVSYVNREGQTGPNKNFIDTYLAEDGLPISLSPMYQGDKSVTQVFANRDPRMAHTFTSYELRPNGSYNMNGDLMGVSTSAYTTLKFLNETVKNGPGGLSNTNYTDAPIMRLGEVMVTYAEAAAELGNITQADLDMSINRLRSRTGMTVAPLQVLGGEPAVNGQVYDDPNRDPTVPSMIWEIRRERRVELAMEGVRQDDLRRWKKLDYVDFTKNPDINRGAWLDRDDWQKPDGTSWLKDVVLEGGDEGYIIPASSAGTRTFTNDKFYLSPIPLDQIKLYEDMGYTLEQNPGW